MSRKLLLIICFIISFILALSNEAHSSAENLSLLTSTLTQLTSVSSKLISDMPRAIPNKEFYEGLEKALENALSGDYNALNNYGDNPSAIVARYMISVSDAVPNKNRLNSNILLLIELFDRVRAKYKPTDKLIITSLASGGAHKEEILLRTLDHFGYKLAKFYAIDPKSNEAIERLKNDLSLKKYEPEWFKDVGDYIKQIIKDKNETPNICLTFFPYPLVNHSSNYFPVKHNFCYNPSVDKILIVPNYINEISLATTTQNVRNLNELMPKMGISSVDAKLAATRIFETEYACDLNLIISFLEIIKLSSSPGNDCIAYCRGMTTNTYYNIASKSIAEMFIATRFQPSINLTGFKIWTYNPQTKQFEQTN